MIVRNFRDRETGGYILLYLRHRMCIDKKKKKKPDVSIPLRHSDTMVRGFPGGTPRCHVERIKEKLL